MAIKFIPHQEGATPDNMGLIPAMLTEADPSVSGERLFLCPECARSGGPHVR
jgi:hypothetical protein